MSLTHQCSARLCVSLAKGFRHTAARFSEDAHACVVSPNCFRQIIGLCRGFSFSESSPSHLQVAEAALYRTWWIGRSPRMVCIGWSA
jgi:hypothetical protein